MMRDTPEDIPVTAEEKAMGFSVQTLDYPVGPLELSGLPGGATAYERTVAIRTDERTRVRRRRTGQGYVCESFEGAVWAPSDEFDTLHAVSESQPYLQYLRSQVQDSPDDE